jgi:hypothetical protein
VDNDDLTAGRLILKLFLDLKLRDIPFEDISDGFSFLVFYLLRLNAGF